MMLIAAFLVFSGTPMSAEEAIEGWLDTLNSDGFGWTSTEGWIKESGSWKAGDRATAIHATAMGSCKTFLKVTSKTPKATLSVGRIDPAGREINLATWDGKTNPWQPIITDGSPGFLILKGSHVEIEDLRLLPITTIKLMGGNDLAGWKIYPGKKSRFTVTPEKWIHVEDGPGDLQSEFQAANFVARITLRTNGKHLNSGLFFRAIPGEFTQAYEAQIRNQFTPGESRDYKIENFDPTTHRVAGSVIVRSEAFDYGTGAIYRRMPARSQAATDGVWFTMTVAAYGRHMATWVNGLPQADWTDNRPDNLNPRQGFRGQKGAFSLQGHDPTTNIDFRALDIQALDARQP
jgi:hypothetical protein